MAQGREAGLVVRSCSLSHDRSPSNPGKALAGGRKRAADRPPQSARALPLSRRSGSLPASLTDFSRGRALRATDSPSRFRKEDRAHRRFATAFTRPA